MYFYKRTTEELQHLHKMLQEEVVVEISSVKEEGASDNISSAEIKELCFYCLEHMALLKSDTLIK